MVKRTFDGHATALKNMSIDLGSFDIFVAKQFLDGADVIAVLQQLGGE